MVSVRYLVKDVDQAIEFYVNVLEFTLVQKMGPAFAKVRKGDLELWLSGPLSSAARPMPNNDQPVPGGWNRFVIETDNINELVEKLKKNNINFRNDIVTGPGGKQIVLDDPFGNPIEVFESA